MPFDSKAAELIRQIDRIVADFVRLENPKIWDRLEQLEPYRKTPQVQKSVLQWVRSEAVVLLEIKEPLLSTLNNYYLQKDFDELVNYAKKALVETPIAKYNTEDEDAFRNNFALALMHLNRDLCAQVELEIIYRKNSSSRIDDHRYAVYEYKDVPLDSVRAFEDVYSPAMNNLTVIYERLGMSDKAKLLSRKTAEYSADPLTAYNASWLYNPKTDRAIDVSLNSLKRIKDEKYVQMAQQMNTALPFFHVGLARKTGLYNRFGDIAGYAILLLLSILFWYYYYRLLAKNWHNLPFLNHIESGVGCLIGIFIVLTVLLFWNLEGSGIWMLFLILVILTLTILFYPVVVVSALSLPIYLLVFGGVDWNTPAMWLYFSISVIAGIIIAVCAKRHNRLKY
jgi:hypothetical protein